MAAFREFYWSARTLRVDYFGDDEELHHTEDVLYVDRMRGITPLYDYGPLIVRLLNEHFRAVDGWGSPPWEPREVEK